MQSKRLLLFLTSFCFFQMGCLEMGPTYSKLPPGPWRGVLKLDPERQIYDESRRETKVSEALDFDEVTEGDLPFNFEVIYTDPENLYLEISNGKEKIRLDQITYLRDRATNKDTVVIAFPPYDSYLKVIFEDNILEGYWYVPSLGSYAVHVVARHGKNHRFTDLKKTPVGNISGKWDISFVDIEGVLEHTAIGEFSQRGNELTGTFITENGDFGFLEGTVQANKMYLSGFNGINMYLIEGIINPDMTITGILRNGIHEFRTWHGKPRTDLNQSSDKESMKSQSDDSVLSHLEFVDLNGNVVDVDSSILADKPTIIQVINTDSYNSFMQTKELTSAMSNGSDFPNIVGLSRNSPERIRSFSSNLQVTYPILRMEDSSSSSAIIQRLLKNDLGTPSLIFLDKSQIVKGILTGFVGPASTEYQGTNARMKEMIEQIR